MKTSVRVNLANPIELQECPGIGPDEAAAIVKFRQEHGPIQDLSQFAGILGGVERAERAGGAAGLRPVGRQRARGPGA